MESFKSCIVSALFESLISGCKSNNSNTRPNATNIVCKPVSVFPNVLIGLYKSNNDVTKDAKLPAVI